MSNSLRPHGLQHARLPCPSPAPEVYSNSCPLRWWCHPSISSSGIPFSSWLQSLPVSRSFPLSQFFTSGDQSIGVSVSVLPMNIQDWFPLGWTGWISLQSKGLSSESSPTEQFKSINSLALSLLHGPTLTSIHDHWKNHSLDQTDLSLSLLQGIFPTQGSNPGLPHCRRILYQLSHQGSPRILEWVACPFSSKSSQPSNRTRVSCIAGRFFNQLSHQGNLQCEECLFRTL